MSSALQANANPANLTQTLARAVELHRQGQFAEAEQLYSAILAVRPDQSDALHYLGLIKLAKGQHVEALQSIAAAMRAGAPSP